MDKRFINLIETEQILIQKIVGESFKTLYLTGGTALAMYFKHRISEDLDFFSQNYDAKTVDKVMEVIGKHTGCTYTLEQEQKDLKYVPMRIYSLHLSREYSLKVDFVQDGYPNLLLPKNGIHSIEDIYFRKCSISARPSLRKTSVGGLVVEGRQAAKDVFDLYYLSKHYKKISSFAVTHFSDEQLEHLCAWYRSFNRMDLKLDLKDLITAEDSSQAIIHLDDEILKKIVSTLL